MNCRHNPRHEHMSATIVNCLSGQRTITEQFYIYQLGGLKWNVGRYCLGIDMILHALFSENLLNEIIAVSLMNSCDNVSNQKRIRLININAKARGLSKRAYSHHRECTCTCSLWRDYRIIFSKEEPHSSYCLLFNKTTLVVTPRRPTKFAWLSWNICQSSLKFCLPI